VAKILVADDNSNIQKMVGLALKDQGIDVVAVGNGEAAVRKISDIRPDLVLADVFMPVRNGYEVCKYVKDDPTLSHIPVILLVGAFDPLDEQEAQRVGADGVLKKPFVPPDPLISMVKSALLRAGVPLGPPSATQEKAPPPPLPPRIPVEQIGPKLAALSPENLPEIEGALPEEEFPVSSKPVSIDSGQSPVAFGSLLETPEAEEETAFIPKAGVESPADRNWGADADEEIEEEEDVEEDSRRPSWRPSALESVPDEDTPSPSRGVPDWREAAFHGNSPAKTTQFADWNAPKPSTELVEAAEVKSVGVSTLEHKPEETAVPFSSDAWAAAMSAGVEAKLAQAQADTESAAAEVPMDEPMEEIDHATVERLIRESRDHAASMIEQQAAPSDTSAAQNPADALAKEPPNSWFSNHTTPWEIDAQKATALASTWDTLAVPPPEPVVAESAASGSFVSSDVALPTSADITERPLEAFESSVTHVEETQEVPVQHELESSSPSSFADPEPAPEPELLNEVPNELPNDVLSEAPNVDELVARVLAKMSPDVLQKVTRELLKPMIETIVRDELTGKK
jgi:CheY-like chemotaxis protein